MLFAKMKHLKKNSATLGYILIITSAALAALLHVIGKPLLGTPDMDGFEINPIVLAATIFVINGLFFTPFTRKSESIKKIGAKNMLLLSFIGIAEVSAMIVFFFGLKDSTAVNASIFTNSEIIFSLLIAMTVFRERLRKKEITPFFMIIFGMIVLPVGYDIYQHGMVFSDLLLGDLLILASGFLYAVDINICKYVSSRFDSKRITQITSFASGIFAFGLIFAFQIPFDINIEQMPGITVLAILGTGLSTLFFFVSLRLLGAVRTVILYSTTAIFGIMFSAIILAEEITVVNIVSIITVMAGIYMLRNKLGEEEEGPISEIVEGVSKKNIPKEELSELITKKVQTRTIKQEFSNENRIKQRFVRPIISIILNRLYEGG